MSCTDTANDRIKQFTAYNNDLGDLLQKTVTLTNVIVESDLERFNANTLHQLFAMVDDKVLDAVGIHEKMSSLLMPD